MTTRIVNAYRHEYEVFVGRPSIFGNPFREGVDGPRLEVIERYRTWFLARVETDPTFRLAAERLRGRVLACYCKPKPYHGDVIVAWCDGAF